jgi:hypothetical protein
LVEVSRLYRFEQVAEHKCDSEPANDLAQRLEAFFATLLLKGIKFIKNEFADQRLVFQTFLIVEADTHQLAVVVPLVFLEVCVERHEVIQISFVNF